MTQEEKAKAYDEAYKRVAIRFGSNVADELFPELKESEDEKIRKGIIDFLWKEKIFLQEAHLSVDNNPKYRFVMDAIAWLEKQGEQKPIIDGILTATNYDKMFQNCKQDEQKETLCDKCKKAQPSHSCQDITALGRCYIEGMNTSNKIVEPKFKVGDWITYNHNPNLPPRKIIQITNEHYIFNNGSFEVKTLEADWHLWTIEDAKEGDVLVNGSNIFIFHFIYDTRLMGYCHVNTDDGRFYDDIGKNECFCLIDAVVTPATKEQHELLFQKMKEAGYVWDAKKKKIENAFNEAHQKLGGFINELSNQFPEVSFAKLSRIAVRVAKWVERNKCNKQNE